MEEPLNVYEVLRAGPLRTRLQVSARRGLTRFVGRHSELDQLQQALEQAKEGHGQIVGVIGEPGLGKSRLFYEFKLTSQSGCLVLEAFAVSHGKASPYFPLIELLKTYFQIDPQDDDRTRKEKVAGKVLILERSLEDTLPYLFSLLGIEDEQSSLQQMDAQIRRQRTFDALKKLFLRESLNQPLILIFEDLHWIDTETQGFLDTLSEGVAAAHVLLLVNYRPEYRQEWGGKTYYTQLRLAPLGKAEAEELLRFLLGSAPGLNRLKALIMEKTEGTPFSMEEVVQTLSEEGHLVGERGNYHLETTPTELHISPTVQGVLAARIDRLTAEEKALLQQLSVIGRQFPRSLAQHVVAQPEDELYRLLSVLQAKEFLYEQPAFPEVEYLFKHALTQEVAYGTVLQEQRKALHEQTGQAIEALYTDSLEDHYSALAYHYSRSENAEKAITYLQHAGQQAVRRSANEEALHNLTAALALLGSLPDTGKRVQQEVAIQLSLGPVYISTKGYSTREVEQVYSRARELCRQQDDSLQLFPALWGLWIYHVVRAELVVSYELGEHLLQLAQQHQDVALLIEAHYALGVTLSYRGDQVASQRHFDQLLALYDPDKHAFLAALYGGQHTGVTCRSFGAWGLWILGYPDLALKRVQEAITLAQYFSHPYSLTFAFDTGSQVHHMCRNVAAVREHAEAVSSLAATHGFAFMRARGEMLRGWALTKNGQERDGLAHLRHGISAYRAQGVETLIPLSLAMLGEAYGHIGQPQDGLAVVAEALTRVRQTGEHLYEAELYRLQGELTLRQSQDAGEAESCFHKAIEIAQKQEAKSWELRAATSLARLWQQQGKPTEARNLLAPVYGWFTEGFDTADLKDAKALLDTLV